MDLITYAILKKYVDNSLIGAGALKGQDGKSAYDIAVEEGFSGTKTEWLDSLIGEPGETPYIGENGNWFIGSIDTGVAANPLINYSNLEDKPTLNGEIIEGDIEIKGIPNETIEQLFLERSNQIE